MVAKLWREGMKMPSLLSRQEGIGGHLLMVVLTGDAESSPRPAGRPAREACWPPISDNGGEVVGLGQEGMDGPDSCGGRGDSGHSPRLQR